jgi:hypothetical protein
MAAMILDYCGDQARPNQPPAGADAGRRARAAVGAARTVKRAISKYNARSTSPADLGVVVGISSRYVGQNTHHKSKIGGVVPSTGPDGGGDTLDR